jgi:hypothetical protein
MGFYRGPNIVTDGLVFAVDAGSTRSYPGSGTTVTSLVGSATGALNNGVGFTSSFGGGFTFDGADDNISIGSSILNVDAFTVEAIVNITSTGNNNKTIFSAGNGSSTGIWFLKHRSGLGNRLVMHGYDGVNPRVDITSTNVVPDAENAYVAVTFNGTSYQLYINGVADGNSVSDNKVGATSSNFIASLNGGSEAPGTIYAVRLYNKALSATEVAQNFNSQKTRFVI